MKLTGNTILITGGGSGIGRGLAEQFQALGNQVIIAGRRRQALEQTAAQNARQKPGMRIAVLDVGDAAGLEDAARKLVSDYPALNVLVNNAGIMRIEKLGSGDFNVADAEATVRTNLLGPMRLTAALLPHLRKQSYSAVMNVSSGLAFVPLAMTPTYCATKAAIHSYTQSLRYQLQGTSTEVLELIPPYVQTDMTTDLTEGQAVDPRAMPQERFIAETMQILKSQPEATEICGENAKALRYAAESGKYDEIFRGLHEVFARETVEQREKKLA
jgi:uncharacterized oxidoreductase